MGSRSIFGSGRWMVLALHGRCLARVVRAARVLEIRLVGSSSHNGPAFGLSASERNAKRLERSLLNFRLLLHSKTRRTSPSGLYVDGQLSIGRVSSFVSRVSLVADVLFWA